MMEPNSRKNQTYNQMASSVFRNNLVLVSLVIILVSPSFVSSSPPLEYFVYTSSQPHESRASSRIAGQTPTLTPLKAIYSLAGSVDANLPANNKKQEQQHQLELADRVLALVKNVSHTHDNNQVDLETTRYAWHLMERQAAIYMRNRLHAVRPLVDQLLSEAHVSSPCQAAVSSWLDKLVNLEQWAALMWNSWGNFPPAGLFEGSFTDMGSYRGCLGVPNNEIIDEAQYCSLDFQPLVPTRPRFHSIFKRILEVDKQNNKLTHGDFDSPLAVGSHISAHEFGSTRFHPDKMRSKSEVASNSSSALNANKYNKRTITFNGTDERLALPMPELNLTLKAEALIELAHKAQYFYYVKFRIGACMPGKCTKQDIQSLAQAAGLRAILQANEVNCMKKEPVRLNNYQIVAISILSILALVAVCGTIVDLLGIKVDWLLPFSMWTNARKLFDADTAGTHADLECIHGLRFFSMVWVIYGHTILYKEYQSFTHFYEVVETQIPSFLLLPSLNANFSVDTFFVISGILTTYVTWEYTRGDPRKFNKFAFAISRYIRLTPQLAIVILCFFLLPLLGEGPMYKQVTEKEANLCYKGWLTNLLYLQTYTDSEKICIDPSWWLSIEMSFHLLSVFIIVVLIRNTTNGMIVNFAVAFVLTFWGACIHYTNGFAIQYLPSIPQRYEVQTEQTKMFFHRPYPHAASYFIGTALGYLLANRSIKKLTRSQVLQGWFACALGLIISLWGSYYWNLGAPYTQLQATIYYHLCQILWPLSISWIILACSLGHGGIVESILSAPCFVPLGRITYMTYLSHALIIYYHSGHMNLPVEPSMLLFVYAFIANTFLSLTLGVVLTVVYESPILNLQKQLFSYLIRKFDPTIVNHSREAPTILPMNNPSTDLDDLDKTAQKSSPPSDRFAYREFLAIKS